MRDIEPSLIIATEYPFAAAAILSGAKKKSKLISWEHHHFFELKRNLFWNQIFNYSYPRLDAIVSLNEDEKKIYEKINSETVVIPNFVVPGSDHSTLKNKRILSVARLAKVKGMDMIADIANVVLKKFPDWQWKLIGNGELEKELNKRIIEVGISGKLEIQQPVDHQLMEEYKQASLYVMLSRNECFPMTLLEAQSAGLPCISFDCDTGPRHIIKHNQNGLLVKKENIPAMASAIESLIVDEQARNNMGVGAIENIKQFSPANIYQLWSDLFKQLS